MMRPSSMVPLVLVVSVVSFVFACGDAEEAGIDSATPTGSASSSPSPSATEVPVITPPPDARGSSGSVESDGVRELIIWPGGDGKAAPWRCDADAIVQIEDGVVSGPTSVPAAFGYVEGEAVFDVAGAPLDHDGRLTLPVNRDEMGRIIIGWRLCEVDREFAAGMPGYSDGEVAQPFTRGSGTYQVCYADANVEMLGTEIRGFYMGLDYDPGEPVFHPDGTPYDTDGVLTHTPVSRNEDGILVTGWRDCEETDEYPEGAAPAIIVD